MKIEEIVNRVRSKLHISHKDNGIFLLGSFYQINMNQLKQKNQIPKQPILGRISGEFCITPSISIEKVVKSIKYGLKR